MKERKYSNADKRDRAKKRVEQIKGFYTHVVFYFVINTLLVVVKIVGNSHYGETFMGPLWHFSTYATWLFWGLGLTFHAIMVFKVKPFFNKEWEERQIQKYMEEDEKESKKFE